MLGRTVVVLVGMLFIAGGSSAPCVAVTRKNILDWMTSDFDLVVPRPAL